MRLVQIGYSLALPFLVLWRSGCAPVINLGLKIPAADHFTALAFISSLTLSNNTARGRLGMEAGGVRVVDDH